MIFLGIDPGVSGGLAAIDTEDRTEDYQVQAIVHKMPSSDLEIWKLIEAYQPHSKKTATFSALEKVGGYLKGSQGNLGSAMFRFGQNYGALRMALTAAGISCAEVHPHRWQAVLGVSSRKNSGETKAQRKRRFLEKAQQLFPDVQVTLATADALLLAEYCRRLWQGPLDW